MANVGKPIAFGMKSAYVPYLLAKTAGDTISVFFSFFGSEEILGGKVVLSKVSAHGKLLLVKNSHYTLWPKPSPKVFGFSTILPGWELVPLWVSVCGLSGVLAWNDPETQSMVKQYKENLEREVRCALAG
jgi:hypothetical protein